MVHISFVKTGRPPKSPPAPFGARLRQLREDANLSQREVAQVLGISQPSYAKWERREVAVTASQLNILAQTLGCVATDFFTVNEPKRKPGPTGRAKAVFAEVSQLPRHHQRELLDILDVMLRSYRTQKKSKDNAVATS